MHILNSTPDDIETIFDFYNQAIAFQKQVSHLHWLPFDRDMVRKEIAEKRQWKIIVNDAIACVFASTFNDSDIWGEKDADPSIYLHRIVTHPAFRGSHFVKHIVEWAKDYGRANGRKFVRLDTWGENEKLIDYYQKCGFRFLGIALPAAPQNLPDHYSTISLSFFEIEIQEQ